MATITPTSDQRQIIDVTTFQVGNVVRAISGPDTGKIGTIINPAGLIPTLIPLPVPHIEMRPVPLPPVPLGTSAPPITSNVDVNWTDGTYSVVPLSTLRRA